MTENGSSVLGRAARVLLACGLLSFGASGLWAQSTTGKVQGTVLDPTGQPIANAQVFVLGTSFAALTNEDGFYFLNNVPAGVYSMRAQFIGYQPAQMEGIRILADQTLTADFRLSGAIALEAITITAAEQPIVPRDQVASKTIVTGEDIDRLPVSSVTAMVLLQPGVVSARGGAISIRGGRANEAIVFVDGAPVRRMDSGDWNLGLATNSLAEVSVTTGAMGAQYGDAQSGVISIVTRTGGSRFVGTFAYESDEMMGKSMATGYNRFEGSLSGPVLGNLTFAVGGTVTGGHPAWNAKGEEKIPTYAAAGIDTTIVFASGSDSAIFDFPRIIQYGGECDAATNYGYAGTWSGGQGYECQGRRTGFGWNTDIRANGKLNFSYGSGSRVSFSALTNIGNNWGTNAFAREYSSGTRSQSDMFVLDWVQQIFRGASSELALNLNLSYQTDKSNTGAFDRQWGIDHRDPPLGISFASPEFITGWDRFGPGDPTGVLQHGDTLVDGGFLVTQLLSDEDWDMAIQNVRYNQGTLRPYLQRNEINNRGQGRVDPWGIGSYTIWGTNAGQTYLDERRYVGRLNVDWQADRYNRFQFGAEGTTGRLNRWLGMGWTGVGFGQAYTAEPYKWAAYAQDRLDLGDVVIELGARFDQFDTRAIFPLVPGRISTSPAFDQTLTADQMTCHADRVTCAADSLDTKVWYTPGKHSGWAPRVRVSFPITDRTGFRMSYAHQTQVPQFTQVYQGTNNDLSNTNTNERFGGDVNLGRSIVFEFGVRHAFNQDMVLDVSAYNKDKVSDITYRTLPFYDTFSERVSNVNVLTNADFGNVRGVDVTLTRRIGRIFSGQVSYTYQNNKSTGSDPQDYIGGLSRGPIDATGERPQAPETLLRSRDDRRHNIQGSFAVTLANDFAEGSFLGTILQNIGAYGTFQVRSGLPYTRLVNNGQGRRASQGVSGLITDVNEPLQSSETPWEKYFDLRVTKDFRLGPIDWQLYADVRNLFNFVNKTNLFAETGDVVNERYFRLSFLEPQLLSMELDAITSGAWTTITKDAGTADERRLGAIDLTSIATTCPGWGGGGGTIACVSLQRAETRWGNGDGLYDVEEQSAAIEDRFNQGNSPVSFYAGGRYIRLGLQLTF